MKMLILGFALVAIPCSALFLKHPIGLVFRIPKEFSSIPVVDKDDDGTKTRLWVLKGQTEEKHEQAIQFISYPSIKDDSVDSQASKTKQALEKAGCVVQVRSSSSAIYGPDSKIEGVTNERILAFVCEQTEKAGVHRILSGDGAYAGAIFMVSYLAETSSPKCPSKEEMESALMRITATVQEPVKKSVPKPLQQRKG